MYRIVVLNIGFILEIFWEFLKIINVKVLFYNLIVV